ncbi:hypothetical protein MHLP_04515 [Candidatus Mycoplasma haematolamae str. Purdue]|uniref:Uncharacterized protein n=1 Tax=Mycoplasma haematolamae (strain Purdue) TaxID=1212765 RepID=I7BKQ3_MYCHA|nr:hypothetical protein [Candidatus Mycoplasma haematolamae]AFO52483.1 hypothetical protein MHLP_04515 [Candidatus Mycoplasma haematolamae str. Purdue]
MNYLYFSKKLNLFSGYLNLLSSISWVALMAAVGYYHFLVLNDPSKEYYYSALPNKSFIQNVFENLKQRTPVTSVQAANGYAWAFIAENGYASFFSLLLGNGLSYWSLIQPVFITSILSTSLNLGMSGIALFCCFKARDLNYLVSSLGNIFVPVYGGLLTLKIHNKVRAIDFQELRFKKPVLPGQLARFRTRLVLNKLFAESVIPA